MKFFIIGYMANKKTEEGKLVAYGSNGLVIDNIVPYETLKGWIQHHWLEFIADEIVITSISEVSAATYGILFPDYLEQKLTEEEEMQ